MEMNQEVEQLVFLSQRLARQKGQLVEAERSRNEHHLPVNALHLHMALSSAMACCLEELPEGGTVKVGLDEADGAVVVEFRSVEGLSAPEAVPTWAGWEELEGLVDSLGAVAERSPTGYGIRILFTREPRG